MNKEKRNILLSIVGIIVLIAGIAGLTIAYFRSRAESEKFIITSKSMTIKFDDPDGSLIRATEIEPITESEILTKATKKTFSISKLENTSKDVYVKIGLGNLSLTDNFKDYDLKWALYQGNNKVTTGTFVQTLDGSTSINLANNILLNSTTPIEYNLYIWINETNQDQSELMNGTLTGKIIVDGETYQRNTLAGNILKESVKTNTPNFNFNTGTQIINSEDPYNTIYDITDEKGLYVQQNDSSKSAFGFPVYYYRGEVTNNYVSFGNYIWRIMGINEDGTIKLIKSSDIGAYKYSSSEECGDETGNCDNQNGYEESNIKTTVENWYTTNLTSAQSNKIVTHSYCSNNLESTKLTQASFVCDNSSEIVNTKIAIPTTDDLLYAGLFEEDSGRTVQNYIGNTSDAFTMTRIASVPNNRYVYSFNRGIVNDYGLVGRSFRVIPIINLKADTIISDGNGTESNPYVIG